MAEANESGSTCQQNGVAKQPADNRASPIQENKDLKHTEPYCACLGFVGDNQTAAAPRIAVSFSGCGFLGVYHLGSISCMLKHGKQFLRRCDRFAGASAGALAASLLVTCPEKIQDCISVWYDLANEVIRKPFGALSTDYSLITRLEQYVDRVLPEDAHKTACGRLHVSVTCRRSRTNCIASEFGSRDELLKYLIGSCYIPFYAGAKRAPPIIAGEEYIDGGLSINLPKFDDLRTITVSPFTGEADICPEDGYAMFDWRVTLGKQTMKLTVGNLKRGMQALFPPSLNVLQDYYKLGKRVRDDALPFTVRDAGFEAMHHSGESEEWDSWGPGDGMKRQKTESEQRIEAYRQRLSTAREELEKAAGCDAAEEGVNYFENLEPAFKPVKKIILKPRPAGIASTAPFSLNRFAVQSDVNVLMSNLDAKSLGDLDDAPKFGTSVEDSRSWDVDEGALDVDSVLKEAKHKERQQRLEEQRRKKADKQRLSSKQSLDVVKLS